MNRLPSDLQAVVAMLLFVGGFALAGTLDYNDRKAAEAERKARVQTSRQAPVWSKRCERRGMDTATTQADGQPPKLHCVPRKVYTVAEAR